jgi:SAM-dependent methyltransferase
MGSSILAAYARRADEYAEHLGSMASVHPSDLQLVTTWADEMRGPLLDAGCGPGHWSGYLARRGNDVRGIDLVPAFVNHARTAYPQVVFEVASIDRLPHPANSFAGVLAWYSLIHHQPGDIRGALDQFAQVLRPGGGLLLGFFTGHAVEEFDHAVATAYRWPPEVLSDELRAAGFEVIETHTRTGARPQPRPHGAILAQLPNSRADSVS